MRVLRKGMSGEDVQRWQEFLNAQGFNVGAADGAFGHRTFNATAEFQRRNGLDEGGVVGAGTLAKAKQFGFVEDAGISGGGGGTVGEPLGSFTERVLAQIMPNLNPARRAAFFPFLVSAMREFEIATPLRQAAFVAQLAHESGQFRFMEEIWGPTAAQRRYEGRRDLGNIQPGDGFRFKGRGPIQITGRANYKRYGDMLGIDLVNNPALAATPEVGFRTAGLYWRSNGCNALADGQQFVLITRRINGGTNGLDDRVRYYDRARRALGISSGTRGINDITRGAPDTDEEAERVFTRGLDSPGEITPSAEERNAEQPGEPVGGRGAAKKEVSKKATAKKAAARKSPASEAAASKSSARKSPAKKSATKKAGAKKSGTKTSAKKSAAKKSSKKKSAPSRPAKSGFRAGGAKRSGRATAGKAGKGAGKAASKSAAKRGTRVSKAAGRRARGR